MYVFSAPSDNNLNFSTTAITDKKKTDKQPPPNPSKQWYKSRLPSPPRTPALALVGGWKMGVVLG